MVKSLPSVSSLKTLKKGGAQACCTLVLGDPVFSSAGQRKARPNAVKCPPRTRGEVEEVTK